MTGQEMLIVYGEPIPRGIKEMIDEDCKRGANARKISKSYGIPVSVAKKLHEMSRNGELKHATGRIVKNERVEK